MSDRHEVKARGGIAPFGYRWLNGGLVVDKDEAPVRKLIYELFLKHRRKKTVAKILNDLGYRTRRRATFHDVTIDRLLRDLTAKGTSLVMGREVEVQPIISPEIWDRANTILRGTKSAKQPVQLFTGIVFCECGGRMLVSSSPEKYRCNICRYKIPSDDLEAIFQEQLTAFSETESEGLYSQWQYIRPKEKRIIIEQICERIVVGRNRIEIEMSFLASKIEPETEIAAETDEISMGTRTINAEDMPSVNESLLSEIEAARFLRLSKMTVLRKRKLGEIGFFQIGYRIRYSKEKHLLPFLVERERKKTR